MLHRLHRHRRCDLTPQDLDALLAFPDLLRPVGLRDRAMMETLYGTGLRREECYRLDLDDVDLGAMTLVVRQAKGGRSRLLPVGKRMGAALQTYLVAGRPQLNPPPAETAVFVDRFGKRLSYDMYSIIVKGYGRRVKLQVTPHLLRHAFAEPSPGRRGRPGGGAGAAGPRVPRRHPGVHAPASGRSAEDARPGASPLAQGCGAAPGAPGGHLTSFLTVL